MGSATATAGPSCSHYYKYDTYYYGVMVVVALSYMWATRTRSPPEEPPLLAKSSMK